MLKKILPSALFEGREGLHIVIKDRAIFGKWLGIQEHK